MNEYKKEVNTIIRKVAGAGGTLLNEFLDDLLTSGEYEEIARRWQIVKMLESGTAQREIAEKLGVGVATVTRGAKELSDKKGGFRKAITKFGAK
jgi:Trp operon repressor